MENTKFETVKKSFRKLVLRNEENEKRYNEMRGDLLNICTKKQHGEWLRVKRAHKNYDRKFMSFVNQIIARTA